MGSFEAGEVGFASVPGDAGGDCAELTAAVVAPAAPGAAETSPVTIDAGEV